jgi:hypothetical protein
LARQQGFRCNSGRRLDCVADVKPDEAARVTTDRF